MLNWSEVSAPKRDVSFYTHIIAETPFGKFKIEWKSWKENDSYSIMLDGQYIGDEFELEYAKERAEQFVKSKLAELQKILPEEPKKSPWNIVDISNSNIPIATETGSWDGKRSEDVLAEYIDTYNQPKFIVCRVYVVKERGEEFVIWVDKNDDIVDGVTRWMEIPLI